MITIKDIQNLANGTSFQRGQSYFREGAVRNLKFKNNTFEARVHGSERYDVSIELDKKGDIESTYCDCPYDYDGDCKHIVAVGLAALEYVKKEGIANIEHTFFEPVADRPMVDFDKVYAKADDGSKVLFLNQLLLRNIDLQQAFVQFVEGKNQQIQQSDGKRNVIDEISSDIYETLSDLSFDEQTLMDYADNDDYYSEDFGSTEIENMVTEVLEQYQKHIEVYVSEGRVMEALTTWLGVYEGILAATEPEEDDYGIVADYVEHNKAIWQSLMQNAVEKARSRPFNATMLKKCVDLLVERYFLFENDEKSEVFYGLKDFEKLLIALINDAETAAYLQQVFEAKDLVDTPTIYVILHTSLLTNDRPKWLELSKDYAQFDVKIAQSLLDFLIENNRKNEFLAEANRLFAFHKNDIDKLIINEISDDDDLILFKKALQSYCLRKQDIEQYKRLRPHLNDLEKQGVISSQKGNYLNVFYVELLEVELRYEEALTYLRNGSLWGDSRLSKVIEIVVKYFPEETLELVMQHSRASLATGQRGRTIYASIASWLAATKTNSAIESKVLRFTSILVSENNRLPALKDELRSKGLKF